MFNTIDFVSDWKVNAKLNSLANLTRQGFLTAEDVQDGLSLINQIEVLTLESTQLSETNQVFVIRIIREIRSILEDGVQTRVKLEVIKSQG